MNAILRNFQIFFRSKPKASKKKRRGEKGKGGILLHSLDKGITLII
jgi:hypothetical protein